MSMKLEIKDLWLQNMMHQESSSPSINWGYPGGSYYEWGCYGTNVNGADQFQLGTGLQILWILLTKSANPTSMVE